MPNRKDKQKTRGGRLPLGIRRCLRVNRARLSHLRSGGAEKHWSLRFTNMEKLVIRTLLRSRFFWASEWLKWLYSPYVGNEGRFKQKQFVEKYSIAKLVSLSVILVLSGIVSPDLDSSPGSTISVVLVVFVLYSLLESMAATLYVQFWGIYDRADPLQSPNRSILLVLVAYADLIVGFAYLYIWTFGVQGSVSACGGPTMLTSAWDALYFSFVTITTLGYGDFHPTSFWAQLFVVLETLSGLLLLVLMLATFINAVPLRRSSVDDSNRRHSGNAR